jgi:hypothetical protein
MDTPTRLERQNRTYVSRRGIELGHRLLLLKREQGEKVVVGKLHSFYLQKKGRPNWDKSRD